MGAKCAGRYSARGGMLRMLTEHEELYRINKFTGSLANALMAATNEAALMKLWRKKVGLIHRSPKPGQ